MGFFKNEQARPITKEEVEEAKVPRDRWDRPLITPPDGGPRIPYARASSFGKVLEDTSNLDRWGKRQMIRGVAIDPSILERVPQGPARQRGGELSRNDKKALDRLVDAADEAVGSQDKAAIGTAIHAATEAVDLGGDLSALTPHLRERANAYHAFCREWAIKVASVEVFGVEDVNRVAGTWDRTGTMAWSREALSVLDIKTSSTMDYAGIGFAVQLAEYAHMFAYDPATEERTPHESMDLDVAWIIHVGREEGSPIELFRVDIAMGWRHANLVAAVRAARREGSRAISPVDENEATILTAASVAELHEAFAVQGSSWTARHRALASERARALEA